VKLHESESVNGTGPAGTSSEDDEDWAGEEAEFDFSNLFDAPSYSSFIKTAPNSKAKSYEARVASLMKAGMIMSLNNGLYPDAATFLKHGPGFSKAAGNLAASDARAAAIVDMLTAPESPYVMFAMVALPMVSQLFRNHQSEVQQVGATMKERRAERKRNKRAGVVPPRKPPITVHLFRREIKLPIRVNLRMPRLQNVFKAFLTPTQHPQHIAAEVFSDPAVVKALHSLGLFPREAPADEPGPEA
jgi:hypothetical protein